MPKAQLSKSFNLDQLHKRKEFLVAMVLLFVIVIVWIMVSVFASQQKLGISPEDKELARPIKPIINSSVLDVIQQYRSYPEEELSDFPVFAQAQDEVGDDFLIDVRELDELYAEKYGSTSEDEGESAVLDSRTQALPNEETASGSAEVDEATQSGAQQRQDVDL